jgi:fructan beta-fructosidase
MVAVLADERTAVFLDSTDLKKWTVRSKFGPAGDDAGQWECPDLLELPVEGTKEKKWVLIINRNPGAPAGGTGVRYLVGNFDGVQFTDETSPATKLWADYGKDFYATNSFNDMPAGDGRKIWMGWTSNWLYAKDEPTVLWRGAQSIPRTLTLRRTSAGIILVQTPVHELQSLRGQPFEIHNAAIQDANRKIAEAGVKGETYEIEAEFEPQKAQEIGFRLRKGATAWTLVGIVPSANKLFLDRTHSGDVSFSKDFSGSFTATLQNTNRVKLHIFVDRSSVEAFANDGEIVMTDRIYPPPGSDGIELYAKGSGGRVVLLRIWQLASIWATR